MAWNDTGGPDDAVEEQFGEHAATTVMCRSTWPTSTGTPRAGGGAFHRLCGHDGVGDRLLHEHGDPRTAGLLGEWCVGGVGSGDDHAVGARRQQTFEARLDDHFGSTEIDDVALVIGGIEGVNTDIGSRR